MGSFLSLFVATYECIFDLLSVCNYIIQIFVALKTKSNANGKVNETTLWQQYQMS